MSILPSSVCQARAASAWPLSCGMVDLTLFGLSLFMLNQGVGWGVGFFDSVFSLTSEAEVSVVLALLLRLEETIRRLHGKGLFPFNPAPLLRRLSALRDTREIQR
jgi:hypothetical protein